ncbi:hypothetical protein SDRG_15592 [Saprolegnia diclina VS20]|uniref:Helicase-associated domain-containing protein n=1 Tax=Saprolegnia diclina (strain VS20) TaxID=1156394 RepID=T0RAJ8_SAPDV|nr:hypothetical protein SDRG_15592 [Saprolegnia diclina VS20]EQC26562.1 hypothetical protein SDRG_15592 [Saprolegnia diclina VS20]|eukprot:XP_008619992.1 hypothetical protein SDRG_15592 [Saprolegnia diclina VS20]
MGTPKRKRDEQVPRRFSTFVEAATLFHGMTSASFTTFPKFYTIPNEHPWPGHLRGTKLNTAQVRTHYKNGTLHPETIAALTAINFVFDVNELKWELKLIALETYKGLHGDLCIPQDFRVPFDDASWPCDLWGMRLGLAVRSIRQKTDVQSPRYAQLSAMGFVWNVLELSWDTKLLALRTYKALRGDLLVAYSFKVPSDAHIWPPETWNLKLGHAVHNIRQNADEMAPERKAQLMELGFVWDYLELSWEAKVTALRAYKTIHGHLNVPYGFIVPKHGADWPKDAGGMKLGHAVHNIRQNTKELSQARKDQLNAIGFVWHSVTLSWDMKLLALQVYFRRFGNLHVPETFRVPKDDFEWPKKTWHMRLADLITDLQRNRSLLTPKQLDALDTLDFAWPTTDDDEDDDDDEMDDAASSEGDECFETLSICDGFPLVKRLRHLHVNAA